MSILPLCPLGTEGFRRIFEENLSPLVVPFALPLTPYPFGVRVRVQPKVTGKRS